MATTYAIPIQETAVHRLHSHGNGPGHSHGHGRSHYRKVPDRIPLRPTSMNGSFQVPPTSPRKEGPTGRLYSHAPSQSVPQSSWDVAHQANHEHFHSNTQLPAIVTNDFQKSPEPSVETMDTRVQQAVPTFQSRNDDYNYPSILMHHQDPATETVEDRKQTGILIKEAIASVLIPLPYVLASLVFSQVMLNPALQDSTTTEKAKTILENTTYVQARMVLPDISTCALTASTLILVGFVGKIRGTSLDRRKAGLGTTSTLGKVQPNSSIASTIRRLGGRILGVGLPFFAVSQLSGAEVAALMLTAIAGDVSKADSKDMSGITMKKLRGIIGHRRWTVAVTVLLIATHLLGLTDNPGVLAAISGYLAMGLSIFFVPFPFVTSQPKDSVITSPNANSAEKTSAVALNQWAMGPHPINAPGEVAGQSPLIYTPTDTNLTLTAGLILGSLAYFELFISTHQVWPFPLINLAWVLLASGTAAMSLTVAEPWAMQNSRKMGLALGLICTISLSEVIQWHALPSFLYRSILVGCLWSAARLDTYYKSINSLDPEHHHHQHHHHDHHDHHEKPIHTHHIGHSKLTGILLHLFRHRPLIHSILIERDSRRIFYFMSLNFVFMLVQTFYALVTGSLGLLSDSIHMLFDCLALVVGLCASVMSKWPPSTRFPYGYGKMDTLAGFANGVFLMLISVEIVYEAIERLAEGSQMQRIGELLTVSSLGLVVNLVGMSAFGHAHHGHGHTHGHSHAEHSHSHKSDHTQSHADIPHDHFDGSHDHAHGDQSHSHNLHSHDNHDHDHSHHHRHHGAPDSMYLQNECSPLPYSVPPTPSMPPPHAHSQTSHGHHHHHGNENMHGIFLHILADTLGSVAVVISTILIHYTGWAGFDPLASCLIAILIFASAVPLVSSSAKTLLLTVPEDTEFDLREALAGVSDLKGVVGVTVPRFWMGEGDGKVGGVMHVIAGKGFEMEDVRQRAVRYLLGRGMDVLVQVEREGDGRCWCAGGVRSG